MASKLVWRKWGKLSHVGNVEIVIDVVQDELYEPETLLSRKSKCCEHSIVPSSIDLPHFTYRPNQEFDRHYCGHDGWD